MAALMKYIQGIYLYACVTTAGKMYLSFSYLLFPIADLQPVFID